MRERARGIAQARPRNMADCCDIVILILNRECWLTPLRFMAQHLSPITHFFEDPIHRIALRIRIGVEARVTELRAKLMNTNPAISLAEIRQHTRPQGLGDLRDRRSGGGLLRPPHLWRTVRRTLRVL